MSETTIKVRDIGKRYRIGENYVYKTIRDDITSFASRNLKKLISVLKTKPVSSDTETNISPIRANNKTNYFWSLKDISFDVKRGEIVGIIGRNGAGKSTLLKIITGIIEPTEGRIDIYGRIASLLEVGTGFHHELTGRENIYLNGAILGMRKREIERKFDEIVDFSGIHQFVDTPVKYYSSGMRVRLGFSVAAHLEPEILLLDEVLAVGDAAFQKKCLGKIDKIAASEGRTVLFVSHDLAAVQSLCQRGILLEDGRIVAEGSTAEVVDQYLKATDLLEDITLEQRTDVVKSNEKDIIATSLKIENVETGKPIKPTSQIVFKIGYRNEFPVRNLTVHIHIRDFKTGQRITVLDSDNSGDIPETLPPQGTIICTTNRSFITSGRCVVDIAFARGTHVIYHLSHAAFFDIEDEIIYGSENNNRSYGVYLLRHKWSTVR